MPGHLALVVPTRMRRCAATTVRMSNKVKLPSSTLSFKTKLLCKRSQNDINSRYSCHKAAAKKKNKIQILLSALCFGFCFTSAASTVPKKVYKQIQKELWTVCIKRVHPTTMEKLLDCLMYISCYI